MSIPLIDDLPVAFPCSSSYGANHFTCKTNKGSPGGGYGPHKCFQLVSCVRLELVANHIMVNKVSQPYFLRGYHKPSHVGSSDCITNPNGILSPYQGRPVGGVYSSYLQICSYQFYPPRVKFS
jgi:hypothetical protein